MPAVKDKRITVRQLLQHTSGLPEYTESIGLDRIGEVRNRYLRPHDLLDIALAQPAQFELARSSSTPTRTTLLPGCLCSR
ncbi:hypothetical protein [Kibdelosporangium philippinense]|uniref:hypothetical protein n=1 Tax=Kibdelosporangium philippinense TaxID=211113 RepID=UPI00360CB6BD